MTSPSGFGFGFWDQLGPNRGFGKPVSLFECGGQVTGTESNRSRQPPKEPPMGSRLDWKELKSQRLSLLLELRFRPFSEEILLSGKHAFVVGLSCGEHVKDDARELVGSGNIGLGGT